MSQFEQNLLSPKFKNVNRIFIPGLLIYQRSRYKTRHNVDHVVKASTYR